MKIDWKIKKERGNLRPKLYYKTELEPFEIKLCVPMTQIISTIPKPPDVWKNHASLDKEERNGCWFSAVFYKICAPSCETGCFEEMIRLPMRENCRYPEVEESFLMLRKEYEKKLKAAYHNTAFEVQSTLGISSETKKQIAPGITALKMLELFNLNKNQEL